MKSAVIISSLVSLAAAVCNHGTTHFPRSVDEVHVSEFGYNELEGPLNWHGLKDEFIQCAVGKEQSPINIYTEQYKSVPGKSLYFDIEPAHHGAEFINLGSTVEVVANGTFRREGKEYHLAQFHFHTPSEHRIDSEYYPMEMHYVFQAKDESIAVVGFMIEVGTKAEALPLFDHVFEKLDEIKKPGTITETGPLDFQDLEQHLACSNVYSYSGSLTTPPCSESILFNVVKEPVYISLSTYKKVKSVLKFNARYTQNHLGGANLLDNARVVLESKH